MPMTSEWIAPEIFTTHNGVIIYHTYNDEELDQGQNTYWFTTSHNDCEPEFHFDARELDVPARAQLGGHPPYISSTTDSAIEKQRKETLWAKWREREPEIMREIIHQAIEGGILVQDQPVARAEAAPDEGKAMTGPADAVREAPCRRIYFFERFERQTCVARQDFTVEAANEAEALKLLIDNPHAYHVREASCEVDAIEPTSGFVCVGSG